MLSLGGSMSASPLWTVTAGRMRRVSLRQRPGPSGESGTTVVVALAANLGIALAKLAAAIISGSSAMLAESFHAMADTGNEGLLLVAQRKSARPPDENHPLGHGRAAYFWALIAALGVFVTGALLSIRQGVLELLHPGRGDVLPPGIRRPGDLARAREHLASACLPAAPQGSDGAGPRVHGALLAQLDPIARAVLAEDAAAVAGNVIAAVGIGLRQLTGSRVPDGVAALLIGLVLGYVALELARRNGEFLIGRRAPANIEAQVRRTITALRGVTGIGELLVTFLGPRQLRVLARVDIDDGLSGAQVKSLVAELEDTLCRDSPLHRPGGCGARRTGAPAPAGHPARHPSSRKAVTGPVRRGPRCPGPVSALERAELSDPHVAHAIQIGRSLGLRGSSGEKTVRK